MTDNAAAWREWFAARPPRSGLTDGLTQRQREAVRLYVAHLLGHGRPPTRREWAAALGVGFPNGIGCHVVALAKKGVVVCTPDARCGVSLAGATLRLECDPTPAGRRLARLLGHAEPQTESFEQGGGI